jgi:crotonobetainyl-CoA:carnitine CoA-transferase CaiB-like acyl-CoA transferase
MRRLFTAAEAAAIGLSAEALEWGLQRGKWRRICRGVYGDGAEDATDFDRALARVVRVDGVASGGLAGFLHGLDSVEVDTRPLRRRELPAERIVVVEGIPCTDGLQTLVDLAAILDDRRWEHALEGALRKRLTSVADLEAALPSLGAARIPGTSRIRRVLALRPPGAPPTESVLETMMVQLIRTVPELPEPVRQYRVVDRNGLFVARVDLALPCLGVFFELDGEHHKDQPVYDARRETAVVAATGWLCGRFCWTEVVRVPRTTRRRLAAIAEQARRRTFAAAAYIIYAMEGDGRRPLDGVRVLAVEQMQALPYGTQLLARLGADVVKIEPPAGESGRASLPGIRDPEDRLVGATFLRNNLGKRSVAVDLKSPAGRDLFLRLVPRFDVVAENFKAGTMARLGLGYDVIAARHPSVIYVSVSGFGASGESPYTGWPAYASIVEAMSGIYEYMRRPDEAPRANPVGALGDISAALFATVGIFAALRHRELTGEGQQVDVAMLDSAVAMTDIVLNLASLGEPRIQDPKPFILDPFRAADGWFVMQLVREHQFMRLAEVIGCPEWLDDVRLSTRAGWGKHLEDVIRPGIERWAASRTKLQAAQELMAAGVAAGPCYEASEVIADPHLAQRNMVVAMERPDGDGPPVLTPGNPVKLSKVAEPSERRVPWVGEHTEEVLRAELGLDDEQLDALSAAGVIARPSPSAVRPL